MENRAINIVALLLLAVMFVTAVLSMKDDSLTFDELAHITAGYSYLAKQDYRINPEHPPLIKIIPALPLLFLNLNFPDNSQNWLQKESSPAWWVQFDLGKEFIFGSDNNPREIIFWSRLMMTLLLVFLGWLLFSFTKKITNNNMVALGALTLFAFSPTFLAHGRLVNTDVGAALGVLLATFFWMRFLYDASWKNVLFAGFAFGVAMLLKFSLILLIPFFAAITLLYIFLFSKSIIQYFLKSVAVGLAGFILVVWPVYQFSLWNYPAQQQLRDTLVDISGHPVPLARDTALWMTEKEILRAPAQYLRGLLMASQRTVWGNTTYFLGEISAGGWRYYFPVLYFLKEPLALHLLTLLAFFVLIIALWKNRASITDKAKQHFGLFALLMWVIIYWAAAVFGNLNIGVRHLLPVFPFTYILVVFVIYSGIKSIKTKNLRRTGTVAVVLLFLGCAFSSLSAFPYYISYYNKLAGGTGEGYKIAVDSNYDWGQDFYRLVSFAEKEKIDKIYIDYFGGEDVEYWLGKKYIKLRPKEIKELPKGWVAVSANHLMGGQALPVESFDQETGYYNWLLEYEPIAKAGYSIFIYYLD